MLRENDKLPILNGYVTITAIDNGNETVVVDRHNVIVTDGLFSILRALSGDSDGHMNQLKMGADFVNTWTNSGATGTTDAYDGRRILTSVDTTPLFTGTNNYIKVGTEIREVQSVTPTHITLIQPFDTPLANTPFNYYSGNYSEQSPEPASASFDETTMEVVYDSALATSTSLQFNITTSTPAKMTVTHEVHGKDIMNQNSGRAIIDIYSCAIHTANGDVFSYLRFPRVTATETITFKVVWEYTY